MNFEQFPRKQKFRILSSTGVQGSIGEFTTLGDIKLYNLIMRLGIIGTATGNEKIRINFYSSDQYDAILFSSEWFLISDIANKTNFYGRIKFIFSGQFMDSDIKYYPAIETESYTRLYNSYMGFALDSPISQNTSSDESKKAIYMAVFGVAQ